MSARLFKGEKCDKSNREKRSDGRMNENGVSVYEMAASALMWCVKRIVWQHGCVARVWLCVSVLGEIGPYEFLREPFWLFSASGCSVVVVGGGIWAMQQVEFLDRPILSNSTFQYLFRNYTAFQVQYITKERKESVLESEGNCKAEVTGILHMGWHELKVKWSLKNSVWNKSNSSLS